MNDFRISMKINLWKVYWNRYGILYKKCIGIFKCDIMSNGLYNENLDIFFVVWKCFKKFNKVFLNLCDDFIEYRKFLLIFFFF